MWGKGTAATDALGSTERMGWLGGTWRAIGFTGLADGANRPRGALDGFSDGRAFTTLLPGVALRGAFVVAKTFVRRTFVTPGVTLATIKG
jgi:hypothetical protein